jgi:hypothetical protein
MKRLRYCVGARPNCCTNARRKLSGSRKPTESAMFSTVESAAATQRIKRHPVEATAATFALGVIVGGFISWMINRR